MNLIKTKNFELAVYANGDPEAKKFAIVLPGQLDTKDYPHMRSHVDFLAGQGYYALSFDPPGTWESPGEIELYTMTNYAKAIDELIEYFGNKSTFVMGHSRGGALALLAGTINNSIRSFVCLMSNYTYDPAIYINYSERFGVKEWKERGYRLSVRNLPFNPSDTREFKLPYSFIEDQEQYDMLDDLKKCAKPKLFIYGKRDQLATPQVVKYQFDAAAEPKSIYELDSDHDYRLHPNLIEEVNQAVGEFLKNI